VKSIVTLEKSHSTMSTLQHQAPPAAPDDSIASYHRDRASKLVITEPAPFFSGWCKLPDELKIEIFKYVLPTGLELGSSDFEREKDGNATAFEEQVAPLLIALPQEVGLLYDTFYSANSISIDMMVLWNFFPNEAIHPDLPASFGDSTIKMRYPPRSINHFVRHLKIQMEFTMLRFDFLRRLGDGSFGFENLVDVELSINAKHTEDTYHGCKPCLVVYSDYISPNPWKGAKYINARRDEIEAMAPIAFRAKKVRVIYTHPYVWIFKDRKSREFVLGRFEDVWEKPLLGKIGIIGDGQKPVSELYQRYHKIEAYDLWERRCDIPELPEVADGKVMVAGWPRIVLRDVNLDVGGYGLCANGCDRVTTKVMST
jgi:hypothetical protein